MGAARAVLLLLTVWLFAAAWSNDRPADAPLATDIPAGPPKATSGIDLGPLVERQWPDHFETRLTGMNSGASWLMSLPIGVTPGTYLAVHSSGFTERVVIDAEFLHILGHDPDVTPHATHTLQFDGGTLTLVRINSPVSRLVIAEGPINSRRF